MATDTPNIIVRLNYYPNKSNNPKFQKRREFYSGGITDDYMRYIEKGITPSGYIDYIDDRDKSFGLFGKDGIMTKEQKSNLRKAMRATDSVIWDMVISLKEDYGKRNLKEMSDAMALLHAQLNKFFRGAGLHPDNVVWFAGLHENTDNRHIHVSFFEKDPRFLRQKDKSPHHHNGKLRQAGIDRFKLSIEEYFSATSTKLKSSRKDLLTAAQAAFLTRGSAAYEKRLKDMLLAIAGNIPPEGHIGYDSANMEKLRPAIDRLTSFVLKNHAGVNWQYDNFKNLLLHRDGEIREYCKRNRIKKPEDHLVADKIISDLYRRLGNKAIATAHKIRKAKNKENAAAKQSAVKRRIARNDLANAIMQSVSLSAEYERETIDAFNEYLERLEEGRNNYQAEEEMY